jgi:hypothetical protein
MDTFPAVGRKLFMHPAHRTVGVLGMGTAFGVYRRMDDFLSEDADPRPPEDDDREPESGTQDEYLA